MNWRKPQPESTINRPPRSCGEQCPVCIADEAAARPLPPSPPPTPPRRSGLIPLPVLKPLIRSTAMVVAQRCPREFMWKYKFGLRRKGTFRAALGTGNVYHKVLECLLRGETKEDAIRAASGVVDGFLADLKAACDPKSGLLPGGVDPTSLKDKIDKALKVGRAMGLFAWDQPNLWPKMKVMAVEQDLTEPIYTYGRRGYVSATCKADVLLEDAAGCLWIQDHKTTSRSARQELSRYRFGLQARLYRKVVQAWLDHGVQGASAQRVIGCIHSVIQKPTIRQKQNETMDEYVARVGLWYKEKASEDPENPPLVVSAVRFPEDQDDLELKRVVRMTDQLARPETINLDEYYRVDSQCTNPLTGPCEFLDLCSRDPRMWATEIELRYEADPNWKGEGDEDDAG